MIRLAGVGDAPRIVEMVGHFIHQSTYRNVLAVNAHLAPLVLTMLESEHGVCYVAEIVDGELVGLLAGYKMPSPIDGQLVAEELVWWVEPANRNGTHGPKLLKWFETWAKAQGAALVKMVEPVESGVGAYYKRVGYHPIETAWVKRL